MWNCNWICNRIFNKVFSALWHFFHFFPYCDFRILYAVILSALVAIFVLYFAFFTISLINTLTCRGPTPVWMSLFLLVSHFLRENMGHATENDTIFHNFCIYDCTKLQFLHYVRWHIINGHKWESFPLSPTILGPLRPTLFPKIPTLNWSH